ncbi:M56 family metallopeptidase [Brevundimonas sp.]|uniref:M56 family metallopeptidase n=1 Tax=Brevundimonas sp. TaxID=1871086 RepID=UPI003D1154AE
MLALLTELNAALAAAVLIVLLVRRPFRHRFGPRAAYGLWAIVPVAMAAVCLPRTVVGGEAVAPLAVPATLILSVWLLGVTVSAGLIVAGQARFAAHARRGVAGPAITGVLVGRLIMPADSATRWSAEELAVVRAHEHAHRERGDLRVNAVVAVLRCLFWCNPLAQIGADRFRFDQELACDATVMAMRSGRRRVYAEALLKAETAPAPAFGSSWGATGAGALATRMASLSLGCHRPDLAATLCVIALMLATATTAWRVQPASIKALAPVAPPVLYVRMNAPASTTAP